ncbi:MAG TPA: shikimate kinase [Candidatus Binatia bacterium]
MKRPIIITGFMGSGKTKVAWELARRLNLAMVDLDNWIEDREGRSAAQIIIDDGERVFRAIESNALRTLLETKAADIISLGGGAWIEETNREVIDQYVCTTVWLDAPFEMCWTRIEASAEERPLSRTREQALELYERRRPIYQLASIHIQIRDETLEDLIARLVTGLQD